LASTRQKELAMRRGSYGSVSPAGILIEAVTAEPDRLLIIARPTARDAACPACGRRSEQVHSRYDRHLMDLASYGRTVHLRVQVRRFRCATIICPRRIFGGSLADSVAPRTARRTARLESVVHHLGIALGGRPAANLARRLMLPVSRDTLLRVLRRRAQAPSGPVRVIGLDDFAWKRGQRSGTVVCDLERRRIIDLLPDQEPGTVATWLATHPEITTVSRRRGDLHKALHWDGQGLCLYAKRLELPRARFVWPQTDSGTITPTGGPGVDAAGGDCVDALCGSSAEMV
jgi:hypothetical protein